MLREVPVPGLQVVSIQAFSRSLFPVSSSSAPGHSLTDRRLFLRAGLPNY